jgi:hypothetical protein
MAGISITLAGNFAKLDELKSKARKTSDSIRESFKNVASSAAFNGLAAGATAAFAAIGAAAAKAIQKGGEISDMMAQTGAAGDKLLILERAFKNAGIAGEKLPDVLNKMQKTLAATNNEGERVNRAFEKIGLNVEELRAMDPADAFKKTAQAISTIPDPAGRAAAAMEIFGRAGGELLVVMNDPKAFSTARAQVGSLADTLPGVAGEFDTVADAMGDFQTKAEQLGTVVAIQLLPGLTKMVDLLSAIDLGAFDWRNPFSPDLNAADKGRAKRMAEGWAEDDAGHMRSQKEDAKRALDADTAAFWQRLEDEKQQAIKKTAEEEEKAAKKKAEAAQKEAEENAKSRADAMEEYNLDAAILSARLKGDEKRLAALEREKRIREEIKRLESAGFTEEEARKPAEAKVDAETKADEKEAAIKAAQEAKRKTQEALAEKLTDARGRLDSLQYESSIGSISSMQRIGGGGGAVSSGLDYQRQVADLQREANGYLKQLIDVSRRPVDY